MTGLSLQRPDAALPDRRNAILQKWDANDRQYLSLAEALGGLLSLSLLP